MELGCIPELATSFGMELQAVTVFFQIEAMILFMVILETIGYAVVLEMTLFKVVKETMCWRIQLARMFSSAVTVMIT